MPPAQPPTLHAEEAPAELTERQKQRVLAASLTLAILLVTSSLAVPLPLASLIRDRFVTAMARGWGV